MAVLGGLLVACGDDAPVVTGAGQATSTPASPAPATSTTAAGRSYAGDLTTTDGYRYKVTVALGARSATGGIDCPGAAAAGRTYLPVTLIVANQGTDRPAPFPPVRIEMTSAAGGTAGAAPVHVLVRDPTGACTFTPKVPSIPAGSSVVFNGTTPSIDAAAGPGTAGQIQVSVSETRFSLVAPVP